MKSPIYFDVKVIYITSCYKEAVLMSSFLFSIVDGNMLYQLFLGFAVG